MRRKIKRIILLLCILILVCIVCMLVSINLKHDDNSNSEYVAEEVTLNFESRVEKLKNLDTKYYKFGWIQVEGTDIDTPILDYASGGNPNSINYSYSWMSPNYNTDENRPVIMGHNVLNVSSTPMLPNENLADFEELMAFVYYGFAKDNLYIQYTVDDKDEIYLIYAAGFYDYEYDDAESLSNKKDINKYIKNVRKNSIYDYDIDVNNDDEIITIKTCTRYFGADEKQQFIIDARKLRENEKTVKYKVETNKNFKKLNLKEKHA